MVVHFYDPKRYEYAPSQHQFLIRAWHKDHGLPFPPSHDTYYDAETRVLTQGSFQVVAKTPPPWLVKR